MSVNVGDRVRIGRGSVEHVVEWVQGNRARLRSAHRSVMANVDRLTVVEPATRQAGRSIEYASGGCIRVDGKVFRAADRWTEVVVDWDGVRIGGRSYADQPSVVSVHVSGDATGTQFVEIMASGPLEDEEGVAWLTRPRVLELAAKLTTVASQMVG